MDTCIQLICQHLSGGLIYGCIYSYSIKNVTALNEEVVGLYLKQDIRYQYDPFVDDYLLSAFDEGRSVSFYGAVR